MSSAAANGGSGRLSFHQFLSEFASGYLDRFAAKLPARRRHILTRILMCRTARLGGHLFRCPECGDGHYQYHSCNDRHCPRCGQADADAWLARQRQRLLLPVPYFLVTFTVPEPLRAWFASQPAAAFDLLFATSARALQDLAANPRRLGGQLGLLGVLHTWSRTLIFHPHIHFLVPAGALSLDGRCWIAADPDFLFKVQVLGAHFRTLFQRALHETHPDPFKHIPSAVWKTDWVVHCEPAGSGENALRYLSRYIFKTATANRTVELLDNGKVRWRYRDSNTGQPKSILLEPDELIRRFLQHVLPQGYCRVRCFGWLHPAAKVRANRVRALLKEKPLLTAQEIQAWQPPLDQDPEPALPSDNTIPPAPKLPLCPRCRCPMQCLAHWHAGTRPPLPWPWPKARPP